MHRVGRLLREGSRGCLGISQECAGFSGSSRGGGSGAVWGWALTHQENQFLHRHNENLRFASTPEENQYFCINLSKKPFFLVATQLTKRIWRVRRSPGSVGEFWGLRDGGRGGGLRGGLGTGFTSTYNEHLVFGTNVSRSQRFRPLLAAKPKENLSLNKT